MIDSRDTRPRLPFVAPTDVLRVAPGSQATSASTQQYSGLGPIAKQFLSDPLGNTIALLTQPVKDLGTAVFGLTPEELADTGFQTRLRARGINPEMLRPTVSAEEKARATGNSLINVAAIATGGAATIPARTVLTAAGATGLSRAAAIGAVDALTGGVTAGVLTEPPEGVTRAEQALTYGALAVPFGVLGGAMSYGLSTALRARGVNPDLDVPEVVPQRPTGAVTPPSPDDYAKSLLGRVDEAVADLPSPPPPPAPVFNPKAGALSTVLRGVSVGETPQGMTVGQFLRSPQEATRQFLNRVYTKLVDDVAPIDRATDELLKLSKVEPTASGARLPGAQDPYVLARLAKGAPDKALMVLENGPVRFADLQPTGTPSLKAILETADQLPSVVALDGNSFGGKDQLRGLLLARRAIELDARGKPPGPIDLDAARQIVNEASPELSALADQTRQFQSDVLTYLRDAGAISSSTFDAMQSLNNEYVPFFRFLEGEATTGPGVKAGKMGSVTAPIQRIKGGAEELRIIDPFESIVRNTAVLTQVADNAAVGRALANLAEQVGENPIVQRVAPPMRGTGVSFEEVAKGLNDLGEPELAQTILNLPDDVQDELATIFRPTGRLERGTFFVNGPEGKQYYRVDPEVWDAMMANKETLPSLLKPGRFFADVARKGTTASPAFTLRNLSRDAFNNSILSRYGMTPVVDMAEGIFDVVKRPNLVADFKRSGAGFATFTRMNERTTAQRMLHRVLGDPNSQYMGRSRALLEGLQSVAEKGEEAMRLREFTRAMEATGGDRRLAALASRDLLDFNRAGQAMRIANQIIPFLNPQIQGFDKIARTAKANPAAFMAKNLAYLTAPSLALYALNRDNPEYHRLPPWRRDLFWNIPIPNGGRDKFVSIPVPFELGLVFKSGAERVARWIDTQDPSAFDDYGKSLASSFMLPVVPAIARGALTAYANKDILSGRDVVPKAEQDLLPEFQARPDQGNVTRFIAKIFKTSPRMVESVVRAQTGGLGADILKSLDQSEQALAELIGDRQPIPETTGAKGLPIVGQVLRSFLVEEPTLISAPVEKFYEDYAELREFTNSINKTTREMSLPELKALVAEYGPDVQWLPHFERAAEQMNRARRSINLTRRDPNLTTEQKQERILTLGRLVRKIAETINTQYGDFNERRSRQEIDPFEMLNAGAGPAVQLMPSGSQTQPQPTPLVRSLDGLNAQSPNIQYTPR